MKLNRNIFVLLAVIMGAALFPPLSAAAEDGFFVATDKEIFLFQEPVDKIPDKDHIWDEERFFDWLPTETT